MGDPKNYISLGLMSGSSLDGVDLALCRFEFPRPYDDFTPIKNWEILAAETRPLALDWIERLRHLPRESASELARAHTEFGHWLGLQAADFLSRQPHTPQLIASHGHTVFHHPSARFTTQIGEGAALAVKSGWPVVCDFRTSDLARGGQGAPLAPTADRILFSDFDYCLNIGGIANISFATQHGWTAYDIGGANQIWNALAELKGHPYDPSGRLARSGKLVPDLLQRVEQLPFFEQPPPKSLGNDWVQDVLLPLYLQHEASPEDRLHTAVAQLATRIRKDLERYAQLQPGQRLLVTGGGAHNTFFVEYLGRQLLHHHDVKVLVPPADWVDYKEAALIALLGMLRWIGSPNVMSSTTGASKNSIGGAVYLP